MLYGFRADCKVNSRGGEFGQPFDSVCLMF